MLRNDAGLNMEGITAMTSYIVQMTKQQMDIIHRALKYYQDAVDDGEEVIQLTEGEDNVEELRLLVGMSDTSIPPEQNGPTPCSPVVMTPEGPTKERDTINGWSL
jgi:hypothetical protein